MYRLHYGYSSTKDETRIMLYRQPRWADAVDKAADLICTVTRNSLCSYVCPRVAKWLEPHRVYFYIPSTREEAGRFCDFVGMTPYWRVDEETRRPVDEYVEDEADHGGEGGDGGFDHNSSHPLFEGLYDQT
jgi:hypothetical protein